MTRSTDDNAGGKRAFGDAVRNFQDAAEAFAASARDQASERAAAFLDEAAARLRGDAAAAGPGDAERRAGAGHSGRRRHGPRGVHRHRGDGVIVARRRLHRDVARGRIAGVCAGIADYFGVETWVTRCAAVVGLIFMGQVTLPAYLVAWVVMERAPVPGEPSRRRHRGGAEGAAAPNGIEAGFSARRRLKALLADAAELELRLRRMETHVTSGQYALQRELRDIEES